MPQSISVLQLNFYLNFLLVFKVELFAGAGGMSLGLEKYFNVKWVVDNDQLASATLQANKANSNVQIYTEDVKTFLKRSVQEHPCYPSKDEVEHIHASRKFHAYDLHIHKPAFRWYILTPTSSCQLSSSLQGFL